MGEVNPLQVLLFLLAFGAILFLAYVATRYIAGKTNRALKGKNIQIIETVSLGMDKRIHLVRAGNKHILVSSTSKQIGFLTDVIIDGQEEKEAETPAIQNVFNFKDLFERYANVYRKKNEGDYGKTDAPADETGMNSFRTNLGRLRSIVKQTDQVKKDEDDATNEK